MSERRSAGVIPEQGASLTYIFGILERSVRAEKLIVLRRSSHGQCICKVNAEGRQTKQYAFFLALHQVPNEARSRTKLPAAVIVKDVVFKRGVWGRMRYIHVRYGDTHHVMMAASFNNSVEHHAGPAGRMGIIRLNDNPYGV